jgi:hypothetical protein
MPSQLLVNTIASLGEVQSIDLSYEALSAEDVSMLAEALKTNTSVTSINLSSN